MNQLIATVLQHFEEKLVLQQMIDRFRRSNQRYVLKNEIFQAFAEYCEETHKPAHFLHSSHIAHLIQYSHELLLEDDRIWLVLRPWIGSQETWAFDPGLTGCEAMSPKSMLEARDRFVDRAQSNLFEIDVTPFYENSPTINDPRNIGEGLAFLNRYLTNEVVDDRDYWLNVLFDVLHRHDYEGVPLLINDQIQSAEQLAQQIKHGIQILRSRPPEEPYESIHPDLQRMGFEPGWGNTAERAREMMELLEQMITMPQSAILEAFVARFPSVFRVASISIHGWVGQEELGRPETLGQVAYVLDQARNLDRQLQQNIELAGLKMLNIQAQVVVLTRLIPNCEGTQCALPLEKIDDTENAWILRVPFREFNPKVTDNWISRYDIWGYLETYAIDAQARLIQQMGGKPDLIIGNYSDGNLVASLMARQLNVTHCNIAHSLEKPKHLFSNLYWQDLEPQYHFSAQFTADLISMNAADFIVTSSYQEIVGSPETVGQYESYKCFTMPQLYHVINGIELFNPKFNRVSPGVDERVFFPYTNQRSTQDRDRITHLIFEQEDPTIFGKLADPQRRPLLAVSPLTAVKNLAGLVECFGRNLELQQRCNLILVTNNLRVEDAINAQEAEEIEKIHRLIDHYQLHNHIRWIGERLSNPDLGEMYRCIADRQGIFVHFARFEAFGRVLLEAMVSGLPSFVTAFGGTTEIIEDDRHGFLINPTDLQGSARKILEFLDRADADSDYWHKMSNRSIHRILDEYNWTRHTQRLLLLTKLYSFWNYVHRDSRESLLHYLDALFHLMYKPRAELILEQHQNQ
ncbi:sucrose synthase [Leptolyngbya sp. NIES-2104]|uniref:sucrose synthase n=1 Tax=Leptolyngbya sp. NIES-2104 TaxID=1552121 RepID=UPI0006EC5401|nr:sucrose synthase [Leptolyngbya sp. NIES-2104]GAP96533.1 sucrose synthase [Leptolyngbya sp. NIES-2104]